MHQKSVQNVQIDIIPQKEEGSEEHRSSDEDQAAPFGSFEKRL